MALSLYVSSEDYLKNHNGKCNEETESKINDVCRHIDTLTFNRIVDKGFDNLTEFQKEIIELVVCKQVDFEYENGSIIDSILSSYSINGVSMGIDANGWNVVVENGVVMKSSLYHILCQTGLCSRRLGAI